MDTTGVLAGAVDTVVSRVSGADRATYLDAVLTQQVADAPAGTATSALLLDAHGAPLLAVDLAVLDEVLLLLAPAELQPEVDRLLAGRTFLADARFATLADRTVVRVVGEAASALVADALGRDVAEGSVVETDSGTVLHLPAGLLVVTSDAEDVLARLGSAGAAPASAADLAAWDVAAGVPSWGTEIAPGSLPEELGLLPTHVHLAKGCYPGQEAVARMWMLGRPRRRLAVVEPDDGVDAGWESGGGRKGARVTRAVATGAGRRALAFVPADAEVGVRVEDGDGTGVRVLRLVGADRPVVGHDPAMTRRRDRA